MIRTEGNTVGKFVITDDVNSKNIETIRNCYKTADLYINNRFEIPQKNYNTGIISNNAVFQFIQGQLKVIEIAIMNHEETIVSGGTPLENFKIKVNFWCLNTFRNVIDKLETDKKATILVDNSISKHEYKMLYWLNRMGADVTVITKDINKIGEINSLVTVEEYKTNENLSYKTDSNSVENAIDVGFELNESMTVSSNLIRAHKQEINNTRDLEYLMYECNETVNICVAGVGSYIDTCDFYGKLYNTCISDIKFKLFENGFEKPTPSEVNELPRFERSEHNYVLSTLLLALKIPNKNLEKDIASAIRTEFNQGSNRNLTGSILYNKLMYTIINIRNIVLSNVEHVVVWGKLGKNDITIIRILAILDDISVVVLQPKKEEIPQEIKNVVQMLELESSMEFDEIPKVDTRDNVTTTGRTAARIADETLYNGEMLGIYKPGKFITCNTRLFSTAYEEIELWWNKDMYLRPKFSAKGIEAELPVMFKVIKGVPSDGSGDQNYMLSIQRFLYGNTLLCKNVDEFRQLFGEPRANIKRGTDINRTSFDEQKPFVYNDKLVKNRIKSNRNYGYGFLSTVKQDFILNKMEEIIGSKLIKFKNKEEFIDNCLSVMLNINDKLLQVIQWFEFYTDNPNLVLVMPDKNMLTMRDVIGLVYMHKMGFDILVYAPTCYSVLEDNTTQYFQYDLHNIGYAYYSFNPEKLYVDTTKIVDSDRVVESQKEKATKKGFLSSLFGTF